MSAYPYQLLDDPSPRLGLIVLQVDETIESDFRRLFPPGAARVHVSRVPSGAELTPETIRTMETSLPAAAALLPPEARFDAVGYACTSGTTLIGAARVGELVRGACRTGAVTDPLTATHAAIRALGLGRVGIVSPYGAAIAGSLRAAVEEGGVTVPDTLSFGEEVEARVARISPASLRAAAQDLAARATLDGIFLSCTNLRTLDIIEALESDLGVPVLSSNQALAWHMAQLSGARPTSTAPGRLFTV